MKVYFVGAQRTSFLIAAALFLTLGIFRVFDRRNDPYDGFLIDDDNTVIRVDAGGPAERAGLKVGDHIRSIDGMSVEDIRTLARRVRPRIGQRTTLAVERRDESTLKRSLPVRSLSFSHAAPPGTYAALNLAGFLIGLCFLACGLAAHLKIASRSGRVLALAGLCLGASFLGAPKFSVNTLRLIVQAILGLALVTGFAALFHFMLESPEPKAFLRRKHALILLYGPALFVAFSLLFQVIVQPSGLNRWSNLLFGLFILVYFGGAAAAMLHTYLKATALERAQYGLHIELAGILVAILPVTTEALLRVLIPRLVLPGADFYFLTIVFIPIALVVAIMRQHRIKECVDDTAGIA